MRLTDDNKPRRLGPKRANNIRKLFNLDKQDDIRDYVNKCLRRKFTSKSGKDQDKAPKIQRLVTPLALSHKKRRATLKLRARAKSQRDAADYSRAIAVHLKEKKAARSSRKSSRKSQK